MARKRFDEETQNDTSSWMTTYSDLVTLLLCFFVLLYSMSSLDVAKFKAVINSFSNSTGVLRGGRTIVDDNLINNGISNSEQELLETRTIAIEIDKYLDEHNAKSKIVLSYNANYVKMSLQGEVLFDSGKANIKPESDYLLEIISNVILKKGYDKHFIEIEGHTDNVVMNTYKYPSNWYLSAARAIEVGNVFIKEYGLSSDRIACTGYGEYRPIAENSTVEGRARNRRVEIKIIVNNEETVERETIIEN